MRTMLWSAACGAAILAAAGLAAAAEEGQGGPPPAAAAAPAAAPAEDVLVLKDGTEIRGRITAEDEAGYAVKVAGSLRVVEKSSVSEVRRGAPAPAPEPAGPADGAKPGESPSDPLPGKKGGKGRRREKGAPETGTPGPDAMPGAPAPAPLSEEGRTWARSCIERLLGADPALQRSAAEALRALGPSVLPILREAHEAADDAGKQRLERLAASIERTPARGPDGGAGAAPGRAAGKAGQPGAPGAPARGAGILDRVRTELALDEAQARTVGPALLAMGRETREILQDARDGLISYEDARTKVSGLRAKLRDDLKATLTADQLTKLDGILDEMGRRMGGGGPPKKDAPPPARPEPPKPADGN